MLISPCSKACNCALLDKESTQTCSDYIHAKVRLEVFIAHWGLLCTETRYYRCLRFGNITVQKQDRKISVPLPFFFCGIAYHIGLHSHTRSLLLLTFALYYIYITSKTDCRSQSHR